MLINYTETSNPDSGATSLSVTSPDSSVAQIGQSSYNPTLKKLSVALQASGTGGTPTQVATAVDNGGDNQKNYVRITYPSGAVLSNNTVQTGAICIELPATQINGELIIKMNVTLYNFSASFPSDLTISIAGYFWKSSPTPWINCYATTFSSVPFDSPVTFGISANNRPCVYIGKTTTAWANSLKVSVDFIEAGWITATIASLSSGWNISIVSAITASTYTQEYLDSLIELGTPSDLLPALDAPLTFNNTLTASSELAGYDSAGDLILQLNNAGGALPGVVTAATAAKGVQTEQLATLTSLFNNGINYLYSRFRYVDNVGGLDTNNGSYNAPYKTMKYSVENNPTGTIHVLMGQSTEPAFSIPADKTNIDIIAQGTRSALNGFTNKVTVLGTGAGSVRFQDLNFGGGLTRNASCTCGIYVYDGSIGAGGFIQAGNGYTEISQTDASNGANTLSAGTTVFYGGKAIAPVITGTGTVVTMDNVGTVIGNSTMGTGGTLYMFETNWAAAASGHAISCVAGTVVTVQGCNFVRPNGTLASISVANYDIQNTDFDRANSVLGTHIGNYDWYAKLGLLNADTVTTAKKMLVRKVTGEIAEQVIPVIDQSYQFNVPAGTLYCEDDNMIPQVMAMRNSLGQIQNEQKALVATGNALSQVDQVFSLSYNAGQTLVLSGEVSIYNNVAITSENYIAIAQVIGRTITGQLVNLGASTQVAMLKAAYAYNSIPFSCTHTTGTSMVAIGVRVTIQYPQINDTAIVDTLFIRATVS